MKKILLSLVTLIVSSVLFILIFEFVNPSIKNNKDNTTAKTFNLNRELIKTSCISDCQKNFANVQTQEHKECVNNCIDQTPDDSLLKTVAIYRYMSADTNSPDNVIKVIYFLTFIALWMMVTLVFYSLFCKNLGVFTPYYFNIVDTALNSPPILGVMGTIYSFAIYTTQLKAGDDLIEGFKSTFFDAAFTTIIAGFIYVINLYLKIIVLKEKQD